LQNWEASNSYKENLDAETTGSKQHKFNISEKDRNNDVNITRRKNENPSAIPVKPSEPSEPSANLNGIEDESKSV
jgi:hypothetical protein